MLQHQLCALNSLDGVVDLFVSICKEMNMIPLTAVLLRQKTLQFNLNLSFDILNLQSGKNVEVLFIC